MARNIYREIVDELLKISVLFQDFSIARWLQDTDVDVMRDEDFLIELRHYREQLELDAHVFCDEEETKKIMEEGLRIHSLLIKEAMYGKEG